MALWEALALQAQVRDRRGAGDEAGELRRRAQTVVDEIAGGIAEDELRDRFLAQAVEIVRQPLGPA